MKLFVLVVLLISVIGIFFIAEPKRTPSFNSWYELVSDNSSRKSLQKTIRTVEDFVPEIILEEEKPPRVKLVLAGDIMLGRTVNIRSLEQGNPKYPFEKVADRLRDADIVFANLESPITYDCPKIGSGFTFCGDQQMTEGLTFSGVDVLSIANNHNMNFGKKGYEETKEILSSKEIRWVGDGNLEIVEVNGTSFGFMGFDFVTNTTPTDLEWNQIRNADSKVDILVVGIHWGNEYKSIANSHQRSWALKALEAGADVISGHHPHWVQNVECITSDNRVLTEPFDFNSCKPVYYSLGNFVFDQMWSENTKKGLAIELTFEEGKLVKEEQLRTYMTNWAQPEWVN